VFSVCTGCTCDCEPEYCGRLSEWIGKLMEEEARKSEEIDEIESNFENIDEVE